MLGTMLAGAPGAGAVQRRTREVARKEERALMETKRKAVEREAAHLHTQLDIPLVQPLLREGHMLELARRLQLTVTARGLDLKEYMDRAHEQIS